MPLAEEGGLMTNRTLDLNEDYAAAGFGGTMVWGTRPALILVDFASAYFDPASPLSADYGGVRANAVRLRAGAYLAGAPVIFTRVEYFPNDPARDGGHFYRKVASLRSFDTGNPLFQVNLYLPFPPLAQALSSAGVPAQIVVSPDVNSSSLGLTVI